MPRVHTRRKVVIRDVAVVITSTISALVGASPSRPQKSQFSAAWHRRRRYDGDGKTANGEIVSCYDGDSKKSYVVVRQQQQFRGRKAEAVDLNPEVPDRKLSVSHLLFLSCIGRGIERFCERVRGDI